MTAPSPTKAELCAPFGGVAIVRRWFEDALNQPLLDKWDETKTRLALAHLDAPEPMTDAEREKEIEAWEYKARDWKVGDNYEIEHEEIKVALALMRAPSAENAQLRAELAAAKARIADLTTRLRDIEAPDGELEQTRCENAALTAENAALRAGGDARLRELRAAICKRAEGIAKQAGCDNAEVDELGVVCGMVDRMLAAPAPAAPKAEAGGQDHVADAGKMVGGEERLAMNLAAISYLETHRNPDHAFPHLDECETVGHVRRLLRDLRAAEKDRDAALAKLAEAERERDLRPVLYHLDDGRFARAMLVGKNQLVVDLTTGDGPSVIGKPDWWEAGYVAAYGGLVPECAEEGTQPGQWSYGVAKLPEFEREPARQPDARGMVTKKFHEAMDDLTLALLGNAGAHAPDERYERAFSVMRELCIGRDAEIAAAEQRADALAQQLADAQGRERAARIESDCATARGRSMAWLELEKLRQRMTEATHIPLDGFAAWSMARSMVVSASEALQAPQPAAADQVECYRVGATSNTVANVDTVEDGLVGVTGTDGIRITVDANVPGFVMPKVGESLALVHTDRTCNVCAWVHIGGRMHDQLAPRYPKRSEPAPPAAPKADPDLRALLRDVDAESTRSYLWARAVHVLLDALVERVEVQAGEAGR